MHRLSREVRFSINPFLEKDAEGFNSFCSMPASEGLALFFEVTVELQGPVEPSTGFVINVLDIDKQVRKFAVPVFARRIRELFNKRKYIGFSEIQEILRKSSRSLEGKFGSAGLCRLTLSLNPFRKIAIDLQEEKMVYFSEKFEFAATHTLWNRKFSKQKNVLVFGKCANPNGHGHNYIVEVTIKTEPDKERFHISDFEKIVTGQLISILDHKNLNKDVRYFSKVIPTVENLAVFGWNKLAGGFNEAKLHCVTIWETDKTFCSYYGE